MHVVSSESRPTVPEEYADGKEGFMRAVLSTLLLLAATSVWAGPVKVTEVSDTAYYIDPESASNKDNVHRVSVIHDYAKPESGGVRSRRVLYEIDCTGERLRSLSATEHSEPMAQGKSVNSWERESEWLYIAPQTGTNIPPRTPYRSIVKSVCSR
jgi:hypothetical protein